MKVTTKQVESPFGQMSLTKLEAENNNWLCPATEDEMTLSFSKEVYLGRNDRADNWKEVDEQYKRSVEARQQTVGITSE